MTRREFLLASGMAPLLPYLDGAPMPQEKFIDSLLHSMTLEEKVGQLNHPSRTSDDTTGAAEASTNIENRIRRGEVGGLGGSRREGLYALQKIAVEESPHGIPLLFSSDVIHGHRTIFPIPLGLACTWHPDYFKLAARHGATEAAASGVSMTWAPMIDIVRDPRWGRVAESFGEDPHIGSVFARAMVEGFQGGQYPLLCTAKHFAGYGQCEGGRDYSNVDISPYQMHNFVLPPFKAAVGQGVDAVMAGFHNLSGIPCTGNHHLLSGLLRGLWDFDGLIVSDYTAIMELVNHGVVPNEKEAAYLAFLAGVDIDLVSNNFFRHLPELVKEGRIDEGDVNLSVRRVLEAKKRIGLFDNPYRGLNDELHANHILTPYIRKFAREVAAASCVLLKNNNILPLSKNGEKKIMVVGPLADSRENMQGTWAVAGNWRDSVTVLEGIKSKYPESKIRYAKGANIVDDLNIAARLNVFGKTFEISDTSPNELLRDAYDMALKCDVLVAVVGEAKEHSGEASTRNDITLPGSQRKLLETLSETGRPLVLVTMSGRPLDLSWEDEHADAILHAWFGGTESGNAIADILFGDVNPSGKLTMTFPRHVGQVPVYYAEPPTGRPKDKIGLDVQGDEEVDITGRRVFRKFTTACRLEGPSSPLYPFGYGLSYTEFEYGPICVEGTNPKGEGCSVHVIVSVTNVGPRAGTEIVQLYVSDPVASCSRPVKELKRWRRIALSPGQTDTVEFYITTEDLKFYRAENLYVVKHMWEPGEFVIHVGPNSRDTQSVSIEWTR